MNKETTRTAATDELVKVLVALARKLDAEGRDGDFDAVCGAIGCLNFLQRELSAAKVSINVLSASNIRLRAHNRCLQAKSDDSEDDE